MVLSKMRAGHPTAMLQKTYFLNFLNYFQFRDEPGGGGGSYAADSTPNLFHLYKNQETNKINIGYLLSVSFDFVWQTVSRQLGSDKRVQKTGHSQNGFF